MPAGWQRNQVVRKSYVPHAARGYRVKLQHQEYAERRTPDNWGEPERAPH